MGEPWTHLLGQPSTNGSATWRDSFSILINIFDNKFKEMENCYSSFGGNNLEIS